MDAKEKRQLDGFEILGILAVGVAAVIAFVAFIGRIAESKEATGAVCPAIGYLILIGAVGLAFGTAGWHVGRGSGRAELGAWLGVLLGPVGLLIVAILPRTPEAQAEYQRKVEIASGGDREAIREEVRRELQVEQKRDAARREYEETMARLAAAKEELERLERQRADEDEFERWRRESHE